MAELWTNKINRNTDWGGDASTNHLPVAGSAVQEFIKSELNDKIGVIYHDGLNSRYLCFTNEDDKNAYLADTSLTNLIMYEMAAPSSYGAKIHVNNHYKAVLINAKDENLVFDYEITYNGEEFIDNMRYEIIINKNGVESKINGEGIYGKPTSIKLDEFLTKSGSLSISIVIVGKTTGATAVATITYDVVDLIFTEPKDQNGQSTNKIISTVYDLQGKFGQNILSMACIIQGSTSEKYIIWKVNDEDIDDNGKQTITGGIGNPLTIYKDINLGNINNIKLGLNSLKVQAYIKLNGEEFYTDIFYKDFIVINGEDNQSWVTIEHTIPKEDDASGFPTLNITQYEENVINYTVHNHKGLASIPLNIYYDDKLVSTVNIGNNTINPYTFRPKDSGEHYIKFEIENYTKIIKLNVQETDIDIKDTTTNLLLDLSALNRNWNDDNRDSWTYGDYTTTFTGFTWSATSGWNNNQLVLSEGNSINIHIAPLMGLIDGGGRTLELEFETSNVTDNSSVICDMRNDEGLGLLITASQASLFVSPTAKVSCNYKANELLRIGFVLDYTKEKDIALIYINGVVSGATPLASLLNIDNELIFNGTDGASIKINNIRVYNIPLSSEQMLNNYIMTRNSISEMMELYNRNNIMNGGVIDIDLVSNFIPVITLTGIDIFDLETDSTTDRRITIDVEYINKQDPNHQFRFYGGCCRIQGTSSASYIRKNWRIYSKHKDWNARTEIFKDDKWIAVTNEDKKISFKSGAVPVNCWTLKADYMESSGTHNTGIATLWNDVMFNALDSNNKYICRTVAQTKALENNYPYDCRTTVDGFPIVVFARSTVNDPFIFMGKYNFNNDKSTENVFGFCDIPGFDESDIPGHKGETIPEGEFNAGKKYVYGNKMQCWELKLSGNNYALFKTTDGWYDEYYDDKEKMYRPNWTTGFEARYPDDEDEADTRDLKRFSDWLISCTNITSLGDNANEENIQYNIEKFKNEKENHLDIWKIAAYYVYLYRFGAIDQVTKNSMLTTEDGDHWYFINYDNDSVLGLDNSGNLIYPPDITRQTYIDGKYAYAGHESTLWNLLERDDEFMTIYVPQVDDALVSGKNVTLDITTVLKYFNQNQSDKWCERIYNYDAEYKYLSPYYDGKGNFLSIVQGTRKSHRNWWLSERFQLMDSKFYNKNYTKNYILLKLEGAKNLCIKITPSDNMYFNAAANNSPIGSVEGFKGKELIIAKDEDFNQEKPINIFSPAYIETLDLSVHAEHIFWLQFSQLTEGQYKLKKLLIGKKNNNSEVKIETLSGLNELTNLEYLDLTGVKYDGYLDISNLYLLKTLILTDSTINTLTLAEGCVIENLYINDVLNSIVLNGINNLTIENIHGIYNRHIPHITISNSPSLTNNFRFYHDWVNSAQAGDSLNLSGINWVGVSPAHLLNFKNIKDKGTLKLTGKIELQTSPSIEELNQIREIFSEPGTDCFLNNSALWIIAPESVYIRGESQNLDAPREMRSGDSQKFTTTIFSENPGIVEWEIESGQEWASIVSNSDNSGVLTTIEDENADHEIVIKAIHKPPQSTDTHYRITLHKVISKKVIYSTGGSIEGNATIKKNEDFTLLLGPNNYNGDYTVIWEMTGNSIGEGKVQLSNATNTGVTVKYIGEVIFESCELLAHVTNKNGSSYTIRRNVTITDESVLMTSTSNPEVIKICASKGWCTEDVMFKEDAWKVSDIGTAFRGGSELIDGKTVERPGNKIKTFNEFSEFLNVKHIPDNAFFQCVNLTEITLPKFVETIGTFAFGSTKIKEFHIPDAVGNSSKTGIYHTAFEGASIERFTVNNNVNYYVNDGVLISSDHIIVKYPEAKMEKEYTLPSNVKGLGLWSIKNTNIEILHIGDNVVDHKDYCISDNKMLHTLYLGSGISATNLARHIVRNTSLINIHIENHDLLYSNNGVLYDSSRKILLKYPEGRNYFTIMDSINTIGEYSVAQCTNFRGTLTIPDHIELIEAEGFFACQYITNIIFNNTSKLHTISDRAFQLSSALCSITLPTSLRVIGNLAFSSCKVLEELKFLGTTAPSITATSFGSEFSNWCGVDAKTRIVYVPASSSGYDGIWDDTIFSSNRSNTVDGITTSYAYEIGTINI